MTADIQQDQAAASGASGPLDFILESCEAIGGTVLGLFRATGALIYFVLQTVAHCFTPPFFPRLILRQSAATSPNSYPTRASSRSRSFCGSQSSTASS